MIQSAKYLLVFVLSLVCVVSVIILGCSSDDDDDDNSNENLDLESTILIENIMEHLFSLQDAAMNNNGHRAAGSQGYNDSVSYIRSILSDTNLIIQEQPFSVAYYEETDSPILEMITPSQITYEWLVDYQTITYSGSGDIQNNIVVIDPVFPPAEEENTSTSGCESTDFDGLDVNGKIAVIQRGSCTFEEKAMNAQNAGASAVIIFNEGQTGRQGLFSGMMSADTPVTIPVLATRYSVGEEIYNLNMTGQEVVLHVKTSTAAGLRDTSNVIVETPEGDENQIIMFGAHLDSVLAGPGINDNGSGSATLLELAYQIGHLGYEPINKIRFGWWSAEESGLVGSFYYLQQLNQTQELDRVSMYFNFDMIGSPNFILSILDSDQSDIYSGFDELPEGSTEIEQVFIDYFNSRSIPTVPSALSGSDFLGFIYFGVPSCGLFTGAGGRKSQSEVDLFGGTAGLPYDSCYHQACDTIDNINETVLLQCARSIAYVAQYYGDYEGSLPTASGITMTKEQMALVIKDTTKGQELLHKDRLFRDDR